MGIDRQRS